MCTVAISAQEIKLVLTWSSFRLGWSHAILVFPFSMTFIYETHLWQWVSTMKRHGKQGVALMSSVIYLIRIPLLSTPMRSTMKTSWTHCQRVHWICFFYWSRIHSSFYSLMTKRISMFRSKTKNNQSKTENVLPKNKKIFIMNLVGTKIFFHFLQKNRACFRAEIVKKLYRKL